jgi:hypothetical protein
VVITGPTDFVDVVGELDLLTVEAGEGINFGDGWLCDVARLAIV